MNSIYNQTFRDFEVILLDDKSTDDSLIILKKYASHPKTSTLVVNEINSGNPFEQWKKGIELAQGKLVWIAESDDYCELNFLDEMIAKFKDDTVLAYCASNIVDGNSNFKSLDPYVKGQIDIRWLSDYYNNGIAEIKNHLRFVNTIPNASAVLFKKKAFPLEWKTESFQYCGDWFIWISILRKGSVYYNSQPLNFFRNHSSTTRSSKSKSKELQRLKEFIKVVKVKVII